MDKIKIKKLEIRKEDILNLSHDEAQKVMGGSSEDNVSLQFLLGACIVGTGRCDDDYTSHCDDTRQTEVCDLTDVDNCRT